MKILIEDVLKQKQKTRYWLFKQTGISYNAVCNLCDNKTNSITFEGLEKICNALECTPNDIFEIEK